MTTGKAPYLFEFNKIGNASTGYISVAEKERLPFQVMRVYWTYFTPDEVMRGGHAHKELQQVLIAVSGHVTAQLEDRFGKSSEYQLTKPSQGLFIPAGFWRTLRFSHDAVLLCLASDVFVEGDYIRTYDGFKSYYKS
jgi:dTDP-4-dehydrorhamnose 3,5-epimerase-like enzyme